MYEGFTDRAMMVMQLAHQEAQRFNHEYVGTEHILLGLVKEGSGVAANVLRNLDVDLRIRLEVERLVQSGPDMVTMGKLPQTPRAKKVIKYSMEEARNLGCNYVGTEHVLLGLLREQEGVAARVLMNLGLKLEEVREELLNLLGPAQINRFTDRARAVLDCARTEARQHGHEYVGTEHLLLGLLWDSENNASRILGTLGIDSNDVRALVERIVVRGPDVAGTVDVSVTPRAKQVLQYAMEASHNLECSYLGTEHLLLGLLREEEGLAQRVLRELGLTFQGVYEEARQGAGQEAAEATDGRNAGAALRRPDRVATAMPAALPNGRRFLALRSIVYALLSPGSVTLLVPWLIGRNTGAVSPLDGAVRQWLGAPPLAAAAAGLVWCIRAFAVRGRGTLAPIDPPQVLVVAGLYRFVRNPMYVSVVTILASEAVLLACWPIAVWAAMVLLATHAFVVVYEEPTLRRQFGQSYVDYCRSVPRWIPRRPRATGGAGKP